MKTSLITFDEITESIARLQVQDNLPQSTFNLSHYTDQCVDLPLINRIKQRKIMAILCRTEIFQLLDSLFTPSK